jgi:hypothetical protein
VEHTCPRSRKKAFRASTPVSCRAASGRVALVPRLIAPPGREAAIGRGAPV